MADLAGYGRCMSLVNQLGSDLQSFAFVCLQVDRFDLCFYSLATIIVLVRWSFEVLARRFSDSMLQQGLSVSDDGGVMTATRIRLTPMLVVAAR